MPTGSVTTTDQIADVNPAQHNPANVVDDPNFFDGIKHPTTAGRLRS